MSQSPGSNSLSQQKMVALLDLADALRQQTDFSEILRLVSEHATSLLQSESATLMMINPRSRETMKTIRREGKAGQSKNFSLIHKQLSGWMILKNEPLLSLDLKSDTRFGNVNWDGFTAKSALGVLLKIEETIIGSLILLEKIDKSAFEDADLALLDKLAAITVPYLRNAQEIHRYFQPSLSEKAIIAKYREMGILGKSKAFVELLTSVEAATKCNVRVLLEGATGTGKELVANAIHKFSERRANNFLAVDCGAIQPHLIESELFGHVKGAYTGATSDRKGLLQAADGGTLFMDEIANLPLEMQAKFMRVLQQGEIRPLGSNKTLQIDVRIVAASSLPLRELVEQKKFREDLYYRLSVYPIRLPALVERHEDTALLANAFLRRFAHEQAKQAQGFHPEILDFLKSRPWPGNIRQLQNFVERLVTLAPPEAAQITRSMLPTEVKQEFKAAERNKPRSAPKETFKLNEAVADYERELIIKALDANDWNQSQTARALDMPLQTLRYRIEKLGIDRPDA